jgi:hypothetical protein
MSRASRPLLLLSLALCFAMGLAWLNWGGQAKAERRLEERIASGKAVPWHFYAPVYQWRGLCLSLPVAALLVGACFMGRRRHSLPDVEPMKALSHVQRAVLAGSMIWVAWSGWQRADQSVWGDEDYTIKTYIVDQVEQDPNGQLLFEKPSWANAVWNYKRPNNHVGFTVLAKAAHDLLYQPELDPGQGLFSERMVRLPALLAVVLSLPALLWLLRVWGWGQGAILALIFVALHPWTLRYSSEARGYGLLLLLVPLSLASATRAAQQGRWRWWLALAAVEFYMLWTWVSAVYLLLPLNAALPWLLWQRHKGDARAAQLGRWLASGLVVTLLICLLMAPLLPQLSDYMRSAVKGLDGPVDLAWFQDAASYLLCGTPWHSWQPGHSLSISVKELPTMARVLGCAAQGALVVLAMRTLLSLLRREEMRPWLLVFLGAPAAMALHMASSGMRPYPWYLMLFMPLFAVLLAGPRRSISGFWWLLLMGGMAWISQPQRQALASHPMEATRESVALTRRIMNPRHPDYQKQSITAGFTMFTEAYDPLLVRFQTAEELKALMQRAKAEGKELYINFSSRAFCRANYPALFQLFDHPQQFERVAELPGQFAAGHREVLRMKRQ